MGFGSISKLIATLLLGASLSFGAAPAVSTAHKTTHKIEMYEVGGGKAGSCSATAIGPHAFLTASHCISVSATIAVDGQDAEVMGTLGDGLDHTIVLERGITFTDCAEIASTRPEQGDEVFVFGNPAGMKDIYRKGYVSGYQKNDFDPNRPLDILLRPKNSAKNENVQVTYYDFNGFFGDSGSAIFNSDGKVTAVTSFIYGEDVNGFSMKFMGSYELRFNKDQIEQAKAYNPPVDTTPVTPKKKSWFDLFTR